MKATQTILVLAAAALASASHAAGPERPRGDVIDPPKKFAVPDAEVVDGETAHELVKKGGVKVVDVRTAQEFAEAHVPSAINIPYDAIEQRHGEIGPSSTPVMVYDRKGNRSLLAIETLRRLGFSKIYNLQRYSAWRASEPDEPAPSKASATPGKRGQASEEK